MQNLCILAASHEAGSYFNVIEALEDTDYYTTDKLNERFRRRSVVAHAAERGCLDTLMYLTKNFDIDLATRETEFSLLFWAAKNTSPDILSYIINPQNGLLDKIDDNTTALHIAAFNGDLDEVKRLLALDPTCIYQLDKNHHSALFYAALKQDTKLVQYLIATLESSDVSKDLDRQYDSFNRGYGHAMWRNARNLDNTLNSSANELDLYKQAFSYFKKIKYICESDYEYLLMTAERIVAHYMHSYNYELAIPFIDLIEHYYEALKLLRAPGESYTRFETDLLEELREYRKRIHENTDSDEFGYESDAQDSYPDNSDAEEPHHNPELEKLLNTLALAQQIAADYGLQCINVDGDGNCFFHVIFQQLLSTSGYSTWPNAQAIREKAIRHMNANSSLYLPFFQEEDGGLESYMTRAEEPTYWADEYLIAATSRALTINLVIFSTHTPVPQVMKQRGAVATIYMMNLDNQHFQSLYFDATIQPRFAIEPIIEAAICDEEFRPNPLVWLIAALEDAEATDKDELTGPVSSAEIRCAPQKPAFVFFKDDPICIKHPRLNGPGPDCQDPQVCYAAGSP